MTAVYFKSPKPDSDTKLMTIFANRFPFTQVGFVDDKEAKVKYNLLGEQTLIVYTRGVGYFGYPNGLDLE